MQQGKILRLISDKGFGFIERPGEKDLFFHAKEVQDGRYDDLREGDTVSFEVREGDKGLYAAMVQKA